MDIDRSLMMQPGSTGDLAFIRGVGQLRMPEWLSELPVTPDLCHLIPKLIGKCQLGNLGNLGN